MAGHVRSAQVDRELDELVACTLNDTDLKTQQQRWLNLGRNFGIARTTTDDGLRLTFRYHPQVEQELRALVAVENDCCAWAAWSVERDGNRDVAMAARSQGEGVATLHTMFTDPCFDRSGGTER
jgi:hypothetical protein